MITVLEQTPKSGFILGLLRRIGVADKKHEEVVDGEIFGMKFNIKLEEVYGYPRKTYVIRIERDIRPDETFEFLNIPQTDRDNTKGVLGQIPSNSNLSILAGDAGTIQFHSREEMKIVEKVPTELKSSLTVGFTGAVYHYGESPKS